MSIKDDDNIQLFQENETLYRVGQKGIDKITIISVQALPHYVYKDDMGHSYFNHNITKSCFRTYDEAVEEQRKRTAIKEKRAELKLYEAQLNVKYNLKNHFIVK